MSEWTRHGRRLHIMRAAPQSAVILAAGLGTKMWPYGVTCPKACLPVGAKPLIAHQIEWLQAAGMADITVVSGHLGQRVRSVAEGFSGVRMVDSSPTGTADAVLATFGGHLQKPVLVVYGDILFAPRSLSALLEAHRHSLRSATALVAPAGSRPRDWIGAELGDGVLRRAVGHGGCGWRLAGLFCLEPAFEPYLRRNPGLLTAVPVGGMPPQEADLAASLNLWIEEGGEVGVVQAEGMHVDLDKPWHILEANRAYLAYRMDGLRSHSLAEGASIHPQAIVEGYVELGPGSSIGPGAIVHGNAILGHNSTVGYGAILAGNCLIGDNTRVLHTCYISGHSTVGNRCKVDHAAEISGVLMDGVYAVHYSELAGVIGTSTDIGAATVCGTLRFDDDTTLHRVKGRRELPESGANSSYIGEFCRTGVNAILMPGVKVGPYSCVGPGVILYDDLPERTLVLAEQTLTRKTWGPERYGW